MQHPMPHFTAQVCRNSELSPGECPAEESGARLGVANIGLAVALWLFATFGFLAGNAEAAAVGPTGYTNAFGSQPSSADWATTTRSGSATDSYNIDADVNANITTSGVIGQTAFSSS